MSDIIKRKNNGTGHWIVTKHIYFTLRFIFFCGEILFLSVLNTTSSVLPIDCSASFFLCFYSLLFMFCCTFRELKYNRNPIPLSLTIQVAKTLQSLRGRDGAEQWWEHSTIISVAWVQTLCVGWVWCWFSSLLCKFQFNLESVGHRFVLCMNTRHFYFLELTARLTPTPEKNRPCGEQCPMNWWR